MVNSSAADVEVEVAINGVGELKKTLMEHVDMVQTARWNAGDVKSMTPNILGDETSLLLPRVTEEPTKNPDEYKWNIVWGNVFAFIYLHACAFYGLYLVFAAAKFATTLWAIGLGLVAILGTTAGAHRLWAHRSYKATWQLRLILIILQTICFQNDVYTWVRNHRVHHKYTDTNADPHNSQRGFFFAHMGWLMIKKHPDVTTKGKHIDLSDLLKDPLVKFQKKYYLILMPLLCFVMPVAVSWYFWNETFWNSWYINICRYVFSLHIAFLGNSAAHMYGYRSYDKSISPTDNKALHYLTLGEGWHNYHHVFPWDYKSAELPTYGANFTLDVINQMAKIGWAYDLKTVSANLVVQRALRTGDGSHGHVHDDLQWCWAGRDMLDESMKYCQMLCKKDK